MNAVFRRDGRGGVPFAASRIARAGQLLDARLDFTYESKEYADHAAACKQLLSELTPPPVYKPSDPPDEYGNVHCVGVPADGSAGFDMFQNEVRQSLTCPPRSRIAIRRKAQVAPVMGCECDGRGRNGTPCGAPNKTGASGQFCTRVPTRRPGAQYRADKGQSADFYLPA